MPVRIDMMLVRTYDAGKRLAVALRYATVMANVSHACKVSFSCDGCGDVLTVHLVV